jgi:hypothetical protein
MPDPTQHVLAEPQRPHIVHVTWGTWGAELVPDVTVQCPYSDDDHDKPCKMWADESGTRFQDGCYVIEWFDDVGYRDIPFELPRGTTPPWDVYVFGGRYEGPELVHVDLVDTSGVEGVNVGSDLDRAAGGAESRPEPTPAAIVATIQYWPDIPNCGEVAAFVGDGPPGCDLLVGHTKTGWVVRTPEGRVTAQPGNWIARDERGDPSVHAEDPLATTDQVGRLREVITGLLVAGNELYVDLTAHTVHRRPECTDIVLDAWRGVERTASNALNGPTGD